MIAALPLSAGANVNPFSDVRADHWAYDAIIKLASVGLVEGYPDGTFGGDRTFTRYEMAMVFARLLARLEGLIEQKIGEGIDAKTHELALELEAVRNELAARIDENYEDLLARIRALELELGDVAEGGAGERVVERVGAAELTDEARAALAAHLTDDMLDQLRILLKEDIDDLARRVRNLERAMLDERDVQRIARQLIADALAAHASELAEAEGDALATARLVDRRVDELESAIAALADEFRAELDQLGVRVSALESRVDEHDEQIRGILARLDNVRLTGKNETTYEQTAVTADPAATGEFFVDPRDEDSDKLTRGNEFRNKFTLNFTATPADNVTVKASLVATTQLGPTEADLDSGPTLASNVSVTTPGVLRSLVIGDLDTGEVTAPFSKYVLVGKKFDNDGDDKKRGAHADLVWGQGDSTSLHAFLSRVEDATNPVDDDVLLYGGVASYKLSDAFDLRFSGVRYVNAPETVGAPAPAPIDDTVYAVESRGVLGDIDYTAFAATYKSSGAIEGHATIPLGFATATVDVGRIGGAYAPKFAKTLEAGKDMVFEGRDWLERHLTPAEDWLDRGERTYAAKLSAPLFGLQASASFGKLVANSGTPGDPGFEVVDNNFVQAELGGLNWAGIEAGLLYDRRVDDNEDFDNTLRATFKTTVLGADLQATVHNRKNDQTWTGAEDQQHTWVTLGHTFNLGLPVKLDARVGASQTAGPGNHTYVGVSVDKYPVGPFAVSAGYSTSRNDVDAGKWWINSKWTNDDVDTATFGLDYTLAGFFGTDIETGYEYKLVRKNGAIDGTGRNTFRASFEKSLRGGEATLAGEGKIVTGGSSSDKRDGTDVSAKLTLTYPVFEGANLTVGGLYVSSTGDTNLDGIVKDDYTAYQIKAGLSFEF